jgi:hypothetical protein
MADTTATTTTTPDFGVFNQLGDYGILGLVTLALGYVGWIFIKRHLAEKDELKEKLLKQNTKRKK